MAEVIPKKEFEDVYAICPARREPKVYRVLIVSSDSFGLGGENIEYRFLS